MKIARVDNDPARAKSLETALGEAGLCNVSVLRPDSDLVNRVGSFNSDLLPIDPDSPSRDALDQMFDVTRRVEKLVALLDDNCQLAKAVAS